MPGRNTDFSDAAARLESLKDDIDDEVNDAVEGVMRDIAVTATRKAPQAYTPGSRNLAESIGYYGGNGLHIVEASAGHAAYVEYGTGASQANSPITGGRYKSPSVAPYGAILQWMRSKPVQPEGGRSLEESAWLIATKIREEGADPHPYMRPAWRQHYRKFKTEGVQALKRAVRENFG